MITDGFGNTVQVGRYVDSPAQLTLGLQSNNTKLEPRKVYRLWASVACFFKFGSSDQVTATTSDHPLGEEESVLVATDQTNVYLAGIVSGGSGLLIISEVDTYTP